MSYIFKFIAFFGLIIISGCNDSQKPEEQEAINDSNWIMIKKPSEVDPFTKRESSSICYVTDKIGDFNILMSGDEEQKSLFFIFNPKNLTNIIQDHSEELSRIRSHLPRLREARSASGGISTHVRIASSSGRGQVISEVIFNKRTPLVYPQEVEYDFPAMKDDSGLEFQFNHFCSYIMRDQFGNELRNGLPTVAGCEDIEFKFLLSDVQILIEESIKSKNSNYVLRVDTYVSRFDYDSSYFKLISHVRTRTYDYQINLDGLGEALQMLSMCENKK